MLKYVETAVTFGEVPSEVTLCINISGCTIHCEGCHSKYLWEDIGNPLNEESLASLIDANTGITCVSFMGGDHDVEGICKLAKFIKDNYKIKVCWYSGMSYRPNLPLEYFDYIKTGPYKADLGGLDSVTTNQRFYMVLPKYSFDGNKVLYRYLTDITHRFQKGVLSKNVNNDSINKE